MARETVALCRVDKGKRSSRRGKRAWVVGAGARIERDADGLEGRRSKRERRSAGRAVDFGREPENSMEEGKIFWM